MVNKSTLQQSPWYILGAGAIGCLWASYWRQAGFQVILLTRSKKNSTTIALKVGEKISHTSVDHYLINELPHSKLSIHNLFVSTKAQDTEQAIMSVLPYLARQANVLVVQNGMAINRIKPLLSSQALYTGITTDGAYRTDDLSVVHAGVGETYINCNASFLKLLPTDFLNIFSSDDIEQRQWQKLVVNCAINGLTALYRCVNGELLTNSEAMNSIDRICDEANAIALKLGIEQGSVDLRELVNQTLVKTANNYSSLYQDIKNGKSTEIEFLNGYLCELANKANVPCPENQRVWKEIKNMQQSVCIL